MSDLVNATNLPVASTEEQVSRAITDPKVTPFSDKYSIQELQRLQLITTPKDTPLLSLLLAKGSVRSMSWLFEWNEATLNTTFSDALYDGFDTSGLSGANGTVSRKSNHIMALAQVAKVGGLALSFETVEGDAMRLEIQSKYLQLLRAMEYYLWNGSFAGDNKQTDGVATLVTTAVDNNPTVAVPTPALDETIFGTAIVSVVDAGQIPTHAFCEPIVAQRIANFAKNRVQYFNTVEANGGIGMAGFTYMTPFGYPIQVVPVRSSFIPTGHVYVLDMDVVTLRHSGANVVDSKQASVGLNDGQAVLFTSYIGLELKNKTAHRVITNVGLSLA